MSKERGNNREDKAITNFELYEKLSELHADHKVSTEKFVHLEHSVEHLEDTVFGGGREGLVEALGRIEERVKTLFMYTNTATGIAVTIIGAVGATYLGLR